MILIRHGESEWNALYRVHQRDPDIRDARLTGEGRRQAARAAEELRAHDVNRIVASPLTRALETADIIARALGLPVSVEPLVCEQFFYSCDVGTPRSRLKELWSHLDFDHLEEEWWQSAKEDEAAVIRRATLFRDSVARLLDWHRIAVVSHWAFIRALSGRDAKNAELVRYDPTTLPPKFEGGRLGWPSSGA